MAIKQGAIPQLDEKEKIMVGTGTDIEDQKNLCSELEETK
jgi:hypothetical protein